MQYVSIVFNTRFCNKILNIRFLKSTLLSVCMTTVGSKHAFSAPQKIYTNITAHKNNNLGI